MCAFIVYYVVCVYVRECDLCLAVVPDSGALILFVNGFNICDAMLHAILCVPSRCNVNRFDVRSPFTTEHATLCVCAAAIRRL